MSYWVIKGAAPVSEHYRPDFWNVVEAYKKSGWLIENYNYVE